MAGHAVTLNDQQFGQGAAEHTQKAAAAAGAASSSDYVLEPCSWMPRCAGPLLICVLDGWGEGRYADQYNAIHVAHTPCMDGLKGGAPRHWRTIKAHGTAGGLPSGV